MFFLELVKFNFAISLTSSCHISFYSVKTFFIFANLSPFLMLLLPLDPKILFILLATVFSNYSESQAGTDRFCDSTKSVQVTNILYEHSTVIVRISIHLLAQYFSSRLNNLGQPDLLWLSSSYSSSQNLQQNSRSLLCINGIALGFSCLSQALSIV
jgi:hypothetical protein